MGSTRLAMPERVRSRDDAGSQMNLYRQVMLCGDAAEAFYDKVAERFSFRRRWSCLCPRRSELTPHSVRRS